MYLLHVFVADFSDDIEEDLSLQGVRFVDSKKLQSNGLIPVGFVVRPKAACLRNNPAAACDRAGFELELASRNRWQCVIVGACAGTTCLCQSEKE